MKLHKKTTSLLFILLTSSCNNYNMKRTIEQDQPQQQIIGKAQLQSGEWVDIVGLMLNQNAPMKLLLTNFDFKKLPEDVQAHIIQLLSLSKHATTLIEAAKTIQSLSLTDKRLNAMINDPQFCQQLIKNLAQKYNSTEKLAAQALNIPQAKYLLQLPQQFLNAIKNRDSDTVQNLAKYVINMDVSFISSSLWDQPPLVVAAQYAQNSCDIINILLNHGYNINLPSQNTGRTALMEAIIAYDKNTTECLLNNPHIVIDQQDNRGFTALMIAGQYYDYPVFKLLLNKGANINTFNIFGETALFNSINNLFKYEMRDFLIQDSPKIIQSLLNNHSLKINHQNNDGNTALLYVLIKINELIKADVYEEEENKKVSKKIIENLLKAGVDPELANNDGLTPLEAAEGTNDEDIIAMIQEAIKRKYEKK